MQNIIYSQGIGALRDQFPDQLIGQPSGAKVFLYILADVTTLLVSVVKSTSSILILISAIVFYLHPG
jgi:hypothetical protein